MGAHSRDSAIKPQRRPERERHQQPDENADELRRAVGEDRERDGSEISERQTGNRPGQQQRRIAQLRIGGARHHAGDVGDGRVGAHRAHAFGQRQEDRAARFEQLRQRAVVDQGVADRSQAAGPLQRLAPHQHAAAGRGGGRAARIVHPGERVEHPEEEDEGRDQHALGKTLAAQLRHQRGEDQAAALGPRHEMHQRVRGIDDVGIGQQQIGRRRRGVVGKFDALVLRPEFSRPPGRQSAARQHGQAVGRAERRRGLARHGRRGVAALIVDQDHLECARIVLTQQRGDGLADGFGFVARGDNRGHGRPSIADWRRPRHGVVVALGRAPEAAARRDEIEPDRKHH